MNLYHYSERPFRGPVKTSVNALTVDMKPHGLWLSVKGEDDWPAWCEAENFNLERLAHVSQIVLQSDAAIVTLATARDIDEFHRTYTAPLYLGDRSGTGIDWPRVAETYDGIVIAPYQWSRRLDGDARWYYGWDCAAGASGTQERSQKSASRCPPPPHRATGRMRNSLPIKRNLACAALRYLHRWVRRGHPAHCGRPVLECQWRWVDLRPGDETLDECALDRIATPRRER